MMMMVMMMMVMMIMIMMVSEVMVADDDKMDKQKHHEVMVSIMMMHQCTLVDRFVAKQY